MRAERRLGSLFAGVTIGVPGYFAFATSARVGLRELVLVVLVRLRISIDFFGHRTTSISDPLLASPRWPYVPVSATEGTHRCDDDQRRPLGTRHGPRSDAPPETA